MLIKDLWLHTNPFLMFESLHGSPVCDDDMERTCQLSPATTLNLWESFISFFFNEHLVSLAINKLQVHFTS